jgi:hypothetical protein
MTTAQDEMIERVTSYIKHNAQKEPGALRALVQQGHEGLAGLIVGLSDEQARYKPSPDDWCVIEVLQHVATANRGVARICTRLAAGETLEGSGREGDEQDGVMGNKTFDTVAEARVAIAAAHQDLLDFIDGPLDGANEATRFNHFIFGDLNCREWAAFQRVHDGDHANQIRAVLESPGFPA